MTLKLGLLASHSGTTLQAILDACASGVIDAQAAVVISNNSKSRALERAQDAGIDAVHLSSATHPNSDDLDAAILQSMQDHGVELVVLAGYMRPLGPKTVATYRNRVINIHPALLPNHGGTGMYGDHVHAAVLAAGDTQTGNTVHLVDEEYDHGTTLAQASVPVEAGDTVDTLSARVIEDGHRLYVETIGRIATGALELPSS